LLNVHFGFAGDLSGINEATVRSTEKRSGHTAHAHHRCHHITGRYDRTWAIGTISHETEILCHRCLDRFPE